MILNGLKLNEEKTELLLLSSRYLPSPSLEFVGVGGKTIQPSSSLRNLGVILDPSADMEDHIKKICKACHFHLINISKIRTYLDRESTEAIIHAFVTTNLDYCDAILYGLPKVLLNRLQLVRNRARAESSKQRLTFLLDRQLFISLRCDLVFMFYPKNHYDFAFA